MWSAAGIEVSFHRIGLSSWVGDGVLRSWAEAPCEATPGGVAVACLPGEAVWLGLTHVGEPATVVLNGLDGAGSTRLQVPPGWQLGALLGADERRHPLALGDALSRSYRLEVQRPAAAASASFELTLMSPAAWSSRFGPLELAPAERPPPVPPYSRIVRPKTGIPRSGP